MNRFAQAGMLLAGLALCLGCGSDGVKTVTVSGKVTMDNQPLPQGSITFIAADGATPTGGGTIADGAYTATVPPGKKVVLVTGSKVVGQERVYADQANSPMREKRENITPPAYNAQHLTPLKADITGPKTDLDFALTAKPASKQ